MKFNYNNNIQENKKESFVNNKFNIKKIIYLGASFKDCDEGIK